MKQFMPIRSYLAKRVSIFFLLCLFTGATFASGLKVIDGLKYFFDSEKKEATLIAYNYSGTINVPEKISINDEEYTITAFDNECFAECQNLKSVNIPAYVKVLGDKCFYHTNLTTIAIPNSVTHLGKQCFSSNENLININLPTSISEISERCFQNSTQLKDISIPSSVEKLGEMCFAGTAIEKIVIPSKVENISSGCFYSCFNLTSIEIPSSITSFEEYAFCGTGFKTFTIPSNIKSIGQSCFSGCCNLKSVNIKSPIQSLPKECFWDCNELKDITIPSSVVSIEERCFERCKNLTDFIVPENVKSIGNNCFTECPHLSTFSCLATTPPTIQNATFGDMSRCILYVPKEAINIYKNNVGWNIFKNIDSTDDKKNLGYITIDNIKYLYDATTLTASVVKNNYVGDIIVPERIAIADNIYLVNAFENESFKECDNLTSITIPNTISVLGDYCFSGCI